MIDKSLFPGAMILPQHYIQMPRPIVILFAKPTVTNAFGMLFGELLPEKLKGNALVHFQLLVNLREIRLCFDSLTASACFLRRWPREQQSLQFCIVQGLWQRPAQVGGRSPFQISLHGTPADPATVGNLSFAQMSFMVKSEDFFDLTHR